MRKTFAAVRDAAIQFHPQAAQWLGAAGVSWGLYGLRPWLGKTVGGVLVILFGVAAERSGGA